MVVGDYTFVLKVTDTGGQTASSSVTVVVQPEKNAPPVAVAGSDKVRMGALWSLQINFQQSAGNKITIYCMISADYSTRLFTWFFKTITQLATCYVLVLQTFRGNPGLICNLYEKARRCSTVLVHLYSNLFYFWLGLGVSWWLNSPWCFSKSWWSKDCELPLGAVKVTTTP